MTSTVDIYNMALGHLGKQPNVSSVSESSKEAEQCAIFYPQALKATLRAHDWKFARKRTALASLGNPPSTWDYEYAYPNNCVSVRHVIADDATTENDANYQSFEVANNDTRLVIYSDQEDAVAVYTGYVTDPNLFDPLFVNALSWHLAFYLAGPLTRKTDLQQTAYAAFESIVSRAQAADQNERKPADNYKAPWLAAR